MNILAEILQNLTIIFALVGIIHLFRVLLFYWNKKEEFVIHIKPELASILFFLTLFVIYSIFGFPDNP